MDRHKRDFEQEILHLSEATGHLKWFTKESLDAFITKILDLKSGRKKKTPDDCKTLKRYDI